MNLKYDSYWNASDAKRLKEECEKPSRVEGEMAHDVCACASDVTSRQTIELKMNDEVIAIEETQRSVWKDDDAFVLTQYHVERSEDERRRANLSFVFRDETYRLFCPLFYKLASVKKQIIDVLSRRGIVCRSDSIDVVFRDHRMDADESLQQLDVKKGDVLVVVENETEADTSPINENEQCSIVLRNEKDVRAFLKEAHANRFRYTRELTLCIGDKEGCESYVPLASLVSAMDGAVFPRLTRLSFVFSIVGVDEDMTMCFVSKCFPALTDVFVYRHEMDDLSPMVEQEGVSAPKGVLMNTAKEESQVPVPEPPVKTSETPMKTPEPSMKTPEAPIMTSEPPTKTGEAPTKKPVVLTWSQAKWKSIVTHSTSVLSMEGSAYNTDVYSIQRIVSDSLHEKTKDSIGVLYNGEKYYVPCAAFTPCDRFRLIARTVYFVVWCDVKVLRQLGVPTQLDGFDLVCDGVSVDGSSSVFSMHKGDDSPIRCVFTEPVESMKRGICDLTGDIPMDKKEMQGVLKEYSFCVAIEVGNCCYPMLKNQIPSVALPELERITLWGSCCHSHSR